MQRILVFSFVLIIFSGCMSKNKMVYVQDEPPRKDLGMEFVNEQSRALIQEFDELYVSVNSFNEDDPGIVSASQTSIGGRSSTDYSLMSYQVDEEGTIDLPLIGETPVVGKTVEKVADEIREELESYFYSPTVKVSFVNKNITVIGLVEDPGRYYYSGENITIFQALGLAGDIQEYGDRENVVIVREENGRISKNVVDLTNKRLFISDFYYLKSGDVLYVEPLNRRIWGIDQIPFSLILSALTTSMLIFDYIRRNDL